MTKNKQDLCNLCRAPLLWAKTVAGNPVPLDKNPNKEGNIWLVGDVAYSLNEDNPSFMVFNGPMYTNHHTTCTLDISKRRTKE